MINLNRCPKLLQSPTLGPFQHTLLLTKSFRIKLTIHGDNNPRSYRIHASSSSNAPDPPSPNHKESV